MEQAARLPWWGVVGVFLTVCVAAFALASGTALAAKVHPFLAQTEIPGSEHQSASLATAEENGHLYVVNSHERVIYNFGPDGRLDPTIPQFPGAPDFEPYLVAVDNSDTTSDGTIWARSGQEVWQLTVGGAPTGLKLTADSVPPEGTPQGGGLPPVVNGGEWLPQLAVDGAGNLYVADGGLAGSSHAINKFSSSGEFLAQVGLGQIPSGFQGLAVDAAGDLWIASEDGLVELDPSGECAAPACAPVDAARIFGVTANRAEGTVVASVIDTFENGGQGHLIEYTESGQFLGSSGGTKLRMPRAVAVNEASGKVFMVDNAVKSFLTFGPAEILPDATTEPATGVGSSNATFHADVGAAEGPDATCVFQYVDEAGFEAAGFAGAQSLPCAPAGPFTGAGSTSVSATVSDLNGGTVYHYRVLASNANGSNPGADLPFETEGPSIGSQAFSMVTETGARLEATINPRGAETTYFFEYVDQAGFEQSGFLQAIRVPSEGPSIGAGTDEVPVSHDIAGLAPGTGYRFRVVATSAVGTARGEIRSIATYAPAVSELPDGRAYEQATPVEKNGSNALLEANAVQAAAPGGAVTFYSNSGIPGASGSQDFPVYQASRLPDGSSWTTGGLLPPAASGARARILGWGDGLTETYDVAQRLDEPPVLYSQKEGVLTQIATGGDYGTYFVADEASDGNTVFFESAGKSLAPGASAKKPNAYVWDQQTGVLSLAGVMNTGKAPSGGTFAGSYEWFNSKNTEEGGLKERYFTRAAHALSTDGSHAFFTVAGSGQLYVRKNPTQPQSPLDKGICIDPNLACTVRVSAPAEGVPDPNQPAAFIGATSDGSSVYFLSAGKLTADATAANGRPELYRFDTASGELTDLTVDAVDPNGADVQGILGTVGDSTHLYFVANGVLAPGATPGSCAPSSLSGSCNLYVLREGGVDFIATLDASAGSPEGELSDERNWAPGGSLPGGNAYGNTARVSADGKTLLFRSSRQLTAYDNAGVPELYLYHPESQVQCVSCDPTGSAPTGPAGLQSKVGNIFATPRLEFGVVTRNLTPAGTRVFFDSPDALVPNDTNGVRDVYEWETAGTGTCSSQAQNGGCLYLLSSGTSPSPSYFGDASVDGSDAFFFTQQALVRQDRDELIDVYDARIGGGIASQNAAEPPICRSESCPGPVIGAPGIPSVGSTAVRSGNPPRKHCRKGFKRVTKKGKERCVKSKAHRKHGRHQKGDPR